MKTASVRVKMCGMTRIDDIQKAIQLGVNAIGLVFYPQSPRAVGIKEARSLLRDIPPFVNTVAVLVNPKVSDVTQLLDELPIDFLQFHGDESPAFCEQFQHPYIKALHGDEPLIFNDYSSAKAILLDSATKTLRGGTGQTFNWELIPDARNKPLILAGGLNELNVASAVASCAPFAVDVCSGVEVSPGVKDPIKMQRFLDALWRNS